MTYDHRTTDLHRADLDREIDTIRFERLVAGGSGSSDSLVARARRGTGRVLIAVGTSLIGREAGRLGSHRA